MTLFQALVLAGLFANYHFAAIFLILNGVLLAAGDGWRLAGRTVTPGFGPLLVPAGNTDHPGGRGAQVPKFLAPESRGIVTLVVPR